MLINFQDDNSQIMSMHYLKKCENIYLLSVAVFVQVVHLFQNLKEKKQKQSLQDSSKYIITQERITEAFIITSVRL